MSGARIILRLVSLIEPRIRVVWASEAGSRCAGDTRDGGAPSPARSVSAGASHHEPQGRVTRNTISMHSPQTPHKAQLDDLIYLQMSI